MDRPTDPSTHSEGNGSSSGLREERVRALQEMYDAGTPIFKKADLWYIGDQIDDIQARPLDEVAGRFIIMPAMNRLNVVDEVMTGRVTNPDVSPDVEEVYTYPSVYYYSFDVRVANYEYGPADRFLFSPGEFSYGPVKRNKHTKELIPPTPDIPAEKVREDLKAAIQRWGPSEHGKAVRQILTSVITPSLAAKKVVAFALGSMATKGFVGNAANNYQHALLLLVQECLAAATANYDDRKPGCFAQDPAYLAEDKTVLHEAGITVLQDPRGFVEVDDEAVVISIAPDVPVKQIIADIARPAIIIWDRNSLQDYDAPWEFADPESSRVKNMLANEYTEVDFPHHEHLDGLVIYVRKPRPENGAHARIAGSPLLAA
ncbi:hypothetical protein B0H63DRAFT_195760 [Podospora didyma]|uniref:SRR1-like domain-containing protein n=1 Tax=Podospora didyma TaxID=330526 RepID=A0AAE0TVD5_9PEZI|nr:hypothetical protein B0H63DRAFT_195760 [Podospora didyma]